MARGLAEQMIAVGFLDDRKNRRASHYFITALKFSHCPVLPVLILRLLHVLRHTLCQLLRRPELCNLETTEDRAMRTRWVPACALVTALGLAFVAEKAWADWRCRAPAPPPIRYEERTEIRYRTEYRTAYRDVQRTIYRSVPETREQEITETVMVPTWREV